METSKTFFELHYLFIISIALSSFYLHAVVPNLWPSAFYCNVAAVSPFKLRWCDTHFNTKSSTQPSCSFLSCWALDNTRTKNKTYIGIHKNTQGHTSHLPLTEDFKDHVPYEPHGEPCSGLFLYFNFIFIDCPESQRNIHRCLSEICGITLTQETSIALCF